MKSFEKQLAESLTFKPFRARKERDEFGLETWTDETRDQIRPGTVIRFNDGVVQIVGHCNEIFGVCDDCTEYGYDDVEAVAHVEQLLKSKKSRRKD